MSEEIKKDVTVDEAAEAKKTEEQQNAPAENKDEKKHPVREFFAKNGKKIAGVGAIIGAVGAGMAIDHFGIKNPFGKKADPEQETAEN